MAPNLKFAYRVLCGHGVDGQRDGIVYRNVLASYAHLRSAAGSDWVAQFVNFVRSQKNAHITQPKVDARSKESLRSIKKSGKLEPHTLRIQACLQ